MPEQSKVANQEFAAGFELGREAPKTVYVEYVDGDMENLRISSQQPERGYILVVEGDMVSKPMLDTLATLKGK